MNQEKYDLNTPLVIVITDELESTTKDEQTYEQQKDNIPNYKRALIDRRERLFTKQIQCLTQPDHNWKIIKTVGDSLIISFTGSNDKNFSDELSKCLASLINAWAEFKRDESEEKIRVAVCLTYLKEIATGEELGRLKNALENSTSPGVSLEPILESIGSDIFGPAMNRAARLAHIPEDDSFVVCDRVMKTLFPSPDEQEDAPDIKNGKFKRLPIRLKIPSENREFAWAYAVPVVNVKGIHTVKYEKPWYVWEIIPFDAVKHEVKYKYKNLGPQFKKFQSIRIVVASFSTPFYEGMHPWEDNARDDFEKKLSKNQQSYCPFFVDFVLKVKGQYQLFDSSIFREFECTETIQWRDVISEIREKSGMIPYYVMFTSVPDIETNNELRKFFTVKSGRWALQHISFDIYESLKIHENLKIDEESNQFNFQELPKYFLLLFQLQKDWVDRADDLQEVFEKADPISPEYPTRETKKSYTTIAYGLIRGEIDGFVLFGSNFEDDSTARLKETIESCVIQKRFFDKTAPIFLYELELMPQFPPLGENIEDLIAARKKHDKERNREGSS